MNKNLFTSLKVLACVLTCLFTFHQELQAQSVTIGPAGTTTSSQVYGPMNVGPLFPRWGRLAMIYPSSLLGTLQNGDIINSLSFRRGGTNVTGVLPPGATFRIYLKNVSQNDFGAGAVDWATVSAGATLVFDGDPSALVTPGAGFKLFNLQNTYAYNAAAGANLAVFFEYAYTDPATDGIAWVYDATGTATPYATNSAKYITIQSTLPQLPATSSLSNSTTNHPQMIINWLAPSLLNVGIPSIVGFTPVMTPGTRNIEIKAKNHGGTPVDSFNVEWTVNGVPGTTYKYTGPLAAQTSANIVLGSTNFSNAQEYNITAWTKNPNGVADANPHNDTATYSFISCNPLSGTFTLNPSQPISASNVHSFSQFIKRLNSCGVSGPVTLNVDSANGPYAGSMSFGPVTGASSVNRITINGNGATLIDTITSTSASMALIELNGAKYFTIERFTIKVDSISTEGVNIYLTNGASDNIIRKNIILNNLLSTSSSAFASIVMSGAITSSFTTSAGTFNRNIIENNTISGGYYGVVMYGGVSGSPSRSNIVRNNSILDFYGYGVYNYVCDSTQILFNDITRPNRTNSTTTYGVYIAGSSTTVFSSEVVVNGNKVHDLFTSMPAVTSTTYGFYLSSNDGATSFTNNAVYNIFNNGANYGFYNSGSDNSLIYHNTVHIDNPNGLASAAYGFYQNTVATGINIRNNIFYVNKTGTGDKFALYFNTPTSTIVSDYNNLFVGTAGTGIKVTGRYNSINYITLTDWKGANGGIYDQNSTDFDPIFANAASGILIPSNASLNNTAVIIPSVTNDINNEPRSATTPDIGAWEFSPLPEDIGVTALTSPVSPFTAGVSTVKVSVKNFGGVPVGTFNVEWTVNGIAQPTYNYSGALASSVTEEIIIGAFNFVNDQSYDIKLWTSNPNGVADNNVSNDTILVNRMACNSLFGAYTINKSLPASTTNFQSIAAAIDRLASCGVLGPVTFNVDSASGPYIGGGKIGLIPGSSSSNTITINGNGAKVIDTIDASETASRYILELDGTQYLTIDNLSLEIESSSTQGFVVHFTNNASYNTIKNSKIINNATSTSNSFAGIVFSGNVQLTPLTAGTFKYNTIENNIITGGYYGVILYGASANPSLTPGTVIKNNKISEFYSYAVYNGYCDSTQITGNEMFRKNRTTTGTSYGVYSNGNNKSILIEKNIIRDFFSDPANTSTSYGVYTTGDATIGKEVVIKNNLIYNIKNNGGNYGFYNSGANYVQYYNNTVLIDNPNATLDLAYGFYQTTTADNIDIKNNIFYVNKGGDGDKYVMYFAATASSISSDYNDLYIGNSGGSGIIALGRYGSSSTTGIVASTLADWKAINGNAYDQNSHSMDPLFLNVALGLVKPTNSLLDNNGVTVAAVTDDILGNPRGPSPDIGAYEFDPIGEDVAVTSLKGIDFNICPGNNNIIANVTNFGVNTITSFKINWSVNGVAQPLYTFNGALPTTQDTSVTIGILNALPNSDYIVRLFTSDPNSGADDNPYNDTIAFNLPTAMSGTYTVGGPASDFPVLSMIDSVLTRRGVCGPVVFNMDPSFGPYTDQITINPVPKASAVNTVTIKGNGAVVQNLATVSANRHIFRIRSADHIILDGIVMKSLGAASGEYGWGIHFFDGADSNIVRNCEIFVDAASTSSTNYVPIAFSGSNTSLTSAGSFHRNIIENNTLHGGYYGINLYTSAAIGYTGSTGNMIRNNKVLDNYSDAIRIYGAADSNYVSNNEISRPSRTNTTTFSAIALENSPERTYVLNNKIHNIAANITSTSAMYGIYATGSDADSGRENIVANNLIYNFNNAGVQYAIYNSGSNGVHYYHNSIALDNQSAATAATYGIYQATAAENIVVKNNSILLTRATTGNKIGLYYSNNTSKIISDYNSIYMGGTGTPSIGRWGTTAVVISTLAAWQAVNTTTPFDLHSTITNPLYNKGSLVPQPGTPLAGTGTPIPGITTDIEGTLRSTTAPYIGAYEKNSDLTGPQISYLPILNSSDTNSYAVQDFATIVDGAGVDTSMANRPRLYYKLYSHANTYADNTSATNGWKYSVSDSVVSPFGFFIDFAKLYQGKPVAGDTIQYFVVSADKLGNISNYKGTLSTQPSSVNLTAANFPINGTDQFLIADFISDTFYVGNNQQQKSLTSNGGMFQFINNNIVGGDITIIIKSSTSETGAHALNKWRESGSGGYKIRIISDTTKLVKYITGSYTGGLIRLNDADNVTIDGNINGEGRYLRFENSSTATNNATMQLISAGDSGCRNITIMNSSILGGTSGNAIGIHVGGGTFPYSNGSGHKNLKIVNNEIYRGSVGINVYGTSASPADSTMIIDNIIGGDGNFAQDNIRLYGMLLEHNNNSLISGNIVRNITNTASQQAWGIASYGGIQNTRITKNKIIRVGSTGTGAFGGRGMFITNSQNTNLVIDNNFIAGMFGNGSADLGSTAHVGMSLSGTSNAKVYYNSVNMEGESSTLNTTAYRSAALYITSANTGMDIKNNTFSNRIFNRADTSYAYAMWTDTAVWSTFDYNNFYVDPSNKYSILGRIAGTSRSTLQAIQAASGNANSINLEPFHVSPLDLHATASFLYQKGTAITGFDEDIDGETRPATPSIGADEYTPLVATDIRLQAIINPDDKHCGLSDDSLSLVINNLGVTPVTNINVTVELTNAVNNTLNMVYTKVLLPSMSDTIKFGSYNFNILDTLNIRAYISAAGDTVPSNDTVSGTKYLFTVPVPPVVVSLDTICSGTIGTLVVSSPATYIKWYDAPVGGNLLATNDSLITPVLTNTKTYYADASNNVIQKHKVGIKSPNGYQYITTTNGYGVFFTALKSSTIDSVAIYPTGTGTVTLQILSASNAILKTAATVNVSGDGLTKVMIPVGLSVEPGTYKLGMDYTGITAMQNQVTVTNGIGYPFVSDAIVIIGGSTSSSTPTNSSYYFFYDWQVTSNAPQCASDRIPVTVTVNPLPSGSGFNQGIVFNGKYKAGTLAQPDSICNADTLSYIVAAPSGTDLSGLGTTWFISNVAIKTTDNVAATGTLTVNGADVVYVPSGSDTNKMMILSARITLNATGCDTTISRYIKVLELPQVNLGEDTTTCEGSVITLDAGAASQYLWSTGSVNQTIDVTVAGEYWVEVYNATGCSQRDTINVSFDAYPLAMLADDTTGCASVTLDAGNPGMEYLWSNGATTQTITVTTSGSYSVKVTTPGLGGCFVQDTIQVVINTAPVVNIGADRTICPGDVITLNAGHPGATYLWSTGETTQTIDVSADTSYSVIVTLNGCEGYDTISIGYKAAPIAFFTAAPTGAANGLEIQFTVPNQNSVSYNWNFGDNTTSAVSNPRKLYALPGTYTVTLTVTLVSTGCTTVYDSTFTVTQTNGVGNNASKNFNLIAAPNPFKESTTIKFDLLTESEVTLEIYDMIGKKVAVLAENEQLSGEQSYVWNIENNNTGMYFARLTVDGKTSVIRLSNIK